MRSRYSAYVLKNTQYIYRTWDEKTRPSLQALREDNPQIFTKLEIINTDKGLADDETATVEFIAHYKIDDDDVIHQHHENSYFVKQNGCWLYVSEVKNQI